MEQQITHSLRYNALDKTVEVWGRLMYDQYVVGEYFLQRSRPMSPTEIALRSGLAWEGL